MSKQVFVQDESGKLVPKKDPNFIEPLSPIMSEDIWQQVKDFSAKDYLGDWTPDFSQTWSEAPPQRYQTRGFKSYLDDYSFDHPPIQSPYDPSPGESLAYREQQYEKVLFRALRSSTPERFLEIMNQAGYYTATTKLWDEAQRVKPFSEAEDAEFEEIQPERKLLE